MTSLCHNAFFQHSNKPAREALFTPSYFSKTGKVCSANITCDALYESDLKLRNSILQEINVELMEILPSVL